MDYMFRDCQKLQSLEINNFVTNPSLSMIDFIANCSSLISLDLYNFDISILRTTPSSSSSTNYGLFYNIKPGLIYCLNITNAGDTLNSLLSGEFNCQYFCFKKGRKFINQ